MPTIDLSILNQRQTPAFYADVFANLPAAGFIGRIFVSTDTFAFYRDNGTGWDLIGGPGTGTITGTGASGQIALWDGASTIIGDAGLTYNGTNNSLTASKFIVTGGTSSQFLKADGSVDSSSYVPYTGATASLDMGANNILGQNFFVRGDNSTSGGFLGFRQFSGSSSGTTGYTSISALQQNSLYFQFSQTNGSNKTFELSTALLSTTPRQFLFPNADGTLALTSNIPSVSGAAGQVSYFNGTNSITGSNDLFFDAVNGHLGIGTITPGTALDVKHDQSTVVQLEQVTATNDIRIAFINSGVGLWRLGAFYNAGANDFGLFDIAAATQPVTVKRTTGQVLIGTSTVGSGKLVVASATGDNGVQIVGASAPSLRIDNAESGPTKRAGLGISTATNNFIQGSADRDFCMFNGSTTASPILFGIYDAGAVNVQEAARISPARNFLIGTATDAGYKLDVNGGGRFNATVIIDRSGSSLDINPTTGQPNITLRSGNTFRGYIEGNSSGGLSFGAGASANIYQTITSAGNVGIGTNAPASKLSVLGFNDTMRLETAGSGANYLAFYESTTRIGYIGKGSSGTNDLYYWNDQNANTIFGTNNTERYRISNSGNLLIGTTTDNGTKLQVDGSFTLTKASTPEILLTDSGSGRTCLIANDSNNAFFRTANGNNFLFQVSGGATALTIKSTRVINISAIPTSAAGLVSGDIYSNLGVLTIVP